MRSRGLIETNAKFTEARRLTADLAVFGFAIDEPLEFAPGQYVTLSAFINGELIRRPYSIGRADSRPARQIEILVRRARNGRLTDWLFGRSPGQRLHVSAARGRLTVDQIPNSTLVMVATGSAVAPFAAITSIGDPGHARGSVVIHGVAHADELAYSELFAAAACDLGIRYVPTVSRPAGGRSHGWLGRVGRVQSAMCEVLCEVTTSNVAVLICGNPDMTRDVRDAAIEHGIAPERIRTESYWVDRPGSGPAA